MISWSDLISIVEKASSLPERLGPQCKPTHEIPDQSEEKLVQARLERWCQLSAQGNWEIFQKRLEWDSLTIEGVRPRLGSISLNNVDDLPEWALTLQSILSWDSSLGSLPEGDPIPFQELYLPFLDFAQESIRDQLGGHYDRLLTSKAQSSLDYYLLKRLSSLGSDPLAYEFSIFRSFSESSLSRKIKQLKGILTTDHYQHFIRQHQDGHLVKLFTKYPVLARLLVTRTQNWIASIVELIKYLTKDWEKLQHHFPTVSGQVEELRLGLSDSHNQERSVIKLTFSSGESIIYKPRSLTQEVAFQDWVSWINGHATSQQLKTYTILDLQTHGWVEVIAQQPCRDLATASRFYYRAGMLLCLLHVLNTTDCHQENLIAHGEYPVVIDLETLAQAEVKPFLDAEMAGQTDLLNSQNLQTSVLRTGLLPRWEMTAEGDIYDLSGLGGVGHQPDPYAIPTWQHINTDQMTLKYQRGEAMPAQINEVMVDGQVQYPANFSDEIVAGFREVYELLNQDKDEILASPKLLGSLANKPTRILFRNSQIYASLLDRSLRPKPLENGFDHSLEFEPLYLGLLKSEDKPNLWPILSTETKALENLDIPYFLTNSSSDYLEIEPERKIQSVLESPGVETVYNHLSSLSLSDLEFQVALLRASLAVPKSFTVASGSALTSLPDLGPEQGTLTPLTPEELVLEAEALAEQLRTSAIASPDGSFTWIGLSILPQAQRVQFQPLGHTLYEGLPGVALFLAALAQVRPGWRDLALGCLLNLQRGIQRQQTPAQRAKLGSHLELGGAVGVGGIVYALTRVGQWLEQPSLLDTAQDFATLITPELVAQDAHFDVISGAAGTLLALLALNDVDPNPELMQRARWCGDHLLHHQTPGRKGGKAWQTVDQQMLSGFSHGAAGIAYALLRLADVAKEERYRRAAQDAIIFEDSLSKGDNWLEWEGDLETDPMPDLLTSWCHGAPGIGLARLGSYPYQKATTIQADIERARQTTQGIPLQPNDTLCCGNLGRIDFLLTLAQTTHNLELHKHCQHQVAAIVQRAHQSGGYQLFPDIKGSLGNPGFFQGMSGVGYELLRMAHPEKFPSVLLWH